jgi:hypothetical protein
LITLLSCCVKVVSPLSPLFLHLDPQKEMMTTHSSVQVDFPQKINQEKEKRELNFLPFSLSLSFFGL